MYEFRKVKSGAFFFLFSVFFCSCERYDAFVHYQYNGTTITRLDKGAVSYFYYGYFSKPSDLPDNYIEGAYHGFDGIMEGYLVFEKDKKVTLVSVTYFEQKGVSTNFLLKHYDNPNFSIWRNSIRSDYRNIVELSSIIKLEKERNLKNISKVNVLYK